MSTLEEVKRELSYIFMKSADEYLKNCLDNSATKTSVNENKNEEEESPAEKIRREKRERRQKKKEEENLWDTFDDDEEEEVVEEIKEEETKEESEDEEYLDETPLGFHSFEGAKDSSIESVETMTNIMSKANAHFKAVNGIGGMEGLDLSFSSKTVSGDTFFKAISDVVKTKGVKSYVKNAGGFKKVIDGEGNAVEDRYGVNISKVDESIEIIQSSDDGDGNVTQKNFSLKYRIGILASVSDKKQWIKVTNVDIISDPLSTFYIPVNKNLFEYSKFIYSV
tara:strand:+ start:1448 stop:2287 length:840 start_codon:yes stop_codon:yes gene_type:complete